MNVKMLRAPRVAQVPLSFWGSGRPMVVIEGC
jgi:hypothetical protein